jgi:hypothetical protein
MIVSDRVDVDFHTDVNDTIYTRTIRTTSGPMVQIKIRVNAYGSQSYAVFYIWTTGSGWEPFISKTTTEWYYKVTKPTTKGSVSKMRGECERLADDLWERGKLLV